MIILKTGFGVRLPKDLLASIDCQWIKRKGEFYVEIPEKSWLKFLDIYPSERSYTIVSGNPPESDPLNDLRADIISTASQKGISSKELWVMIKKYHRDSLQDMDAEQLNYLFLELTKLKNQGVPVPASESVQKSVAARIAKAWAYTDSGIVLLVKGWLWENDFPAPKKPDGSVDEPAFNAIAIKKISEELKSLPVWIQKAIEATKSKESFDGWNKPVEVIDYQNDLIRAIAKGRGISVKEFSAELAVWCLGQGLQSHRKLMGEGDLKKVTHYLESVRDEVMPF